MKEQEAEAESFMHQILWVYLEQQGEETEED